MLNHYQIVEVTTMGTSAVSRVNIETITCTQDDLDNVIVPLYNKQAHCLNKFYNVIGSNKRVHYENYMVFGVTVDDIVYSVNNQIKYRVKVINDTINERNKVCKRSNKLNNRPLDENMLEPVKEIDYLYIG